MVGPQPRSMFSPDFLTWVAEGRLPHWSRDGDFLHYVDHRGVRWVWRLGAPDPRKFGYTMGVWPD